MHSPHLYTGSMVTWSPSRTSVTPAPTSVTVPENSCPKTSGMFLPVSG